MQNLLSELSDLLVYTPCNAGGWCSPWRQAGSWASPWTACSSFGNLHFLAGQMAGKAWAMMAALPLVHWLRERDRRPGFAMA